jgi:carbon storage regulator
MLILTRKTGEKIAIGDNISICVIEVGKGYVKLGIDAPENITILRQEVIDRIREENIQAAISDNEGLMKAVTFLKQEKKNLKE